MGRRGRSGARSAIRFCVTTGCGPGGRCFGGETQLHVLSCGRAGQIVAIAPLLFETGADVRHAGPAASPHAERPLAARGFHRRRPRAAVLSGDLDSRCFTSGTTGMSCSSASFRRRRQRLNVVSGLAAADGCATGIWRSGSSPYLSISGNRGRLLRQPVCQVQAEPQKSHDTADPSGEARTRNRQRFDACRSRRRCDPAGGVGMEARRRDGDFNRPQRSGNFTRGSPNEWRIAAGSG